MALLDFKVFYLVGIKGVAMTALAQCLIDAGKQVAGSDVAEAFVTEPLLTSLQLQIDTSFQVSPPPNTECLIYTAAHQGVENPQVKAAQQAGLPVFSHAEAIGELTNLKPGIAVCGVGGKSTTSAMITWILEAAGKRPSYAVGVGNIPGIGRTGRWLAESSHFVVEADEYAANPSGVARGETLIPRFSYLKPQVIVCTNLKFDHPDVYRDFAQTQHVYATFFKQLKPNGRLIINADDSALVELAQVVKTTRPDISVVSFGLSEGADYQLLTYEAANGQTISHCRFGSTERDITLQIPGQFNVTNALAAIAAGSTLDVPIESAIEYLSHFRSTMRRAEFIGEKNGVRFYDDYAHHPHEVAQVISAYREWFPTNRLVVAFQSHTFSRTKSLFSDFVGAFDQASEVCMLDIFPSAREAFDSSVTSDMLCDAIQQRVPTLEARNYGTLSKLAEHLRATLKPGDVCLTVGAGDIYQVHTWL